jgi:hypothetical protein
MSIERYIQVDDEGYFSFDGQRVDDAKYGKDLLGSLRVDENQRYIASLRGQDAYVEAFDAPLIARHVRVKDGELGQIDLAYGATAEFKWESLLSDEWDRFHGVTLQGVPFVLSRGAQVEFFDLLDGFDMAMQGAGWHAVDANWRSGVEYIKNQLVSALEKHGVTVFGKEGESFDATCHEAVSGGDAEGAHTIVKVLRKGYKCGERILRPAQVTVS